MDAARDEILMFHFSLEEITPLIWRRIEVPAEWTFRDLHEVLQRAFGWENYHLYEFEVGAERISEPDEEFPEQVTMDSEVTRLCDVLTVRSEFLYRYDLGDDWVHKAALESAGPTDPSATYPRCLGGARSAPREDSGGVEGYREVVVILRDRSHAEYEATRQWAGQTYASECFDLESVNASLTTLQQRKEPARRTTSRRK